jgi:hypothetical protein
VAHGGDLEDPVAAFLEVGLHECGELAAFRHVDLVQRDELRPLEERLLAVGNWIGGEFAENHVEVADRVAARVQGGAVENVQQGGAAFDVAEELQAEALALAGAFDESGDVGDGVPHLTGVDDTEVGVQGREGVVGDLGPGGGDGRDQAGLARRRVTDECDIRHGLELEEHVAFVAVGTQQGEPGGLALGGGEGGVAEPALAAGGDDDAVADLGHIGELVTLGVLDDGAQRHGQLDDVAAVAVAVVTHAGSAVGGAAVG